MSVYHIQILSKLIYALRHLRPFHFLCFWYFSNTLESKWELSTNKSLSGFLCLSYRHAFAAILSLDSINARHTLLPFPAYHTSGTRKTTTTLRKIETEYVI